MKYAVRWKTNNGQVMERTFEDIDNAEEFYLQRVIYKLETILFVDNDGNKKMIESYTKTDMETEVKHKEELKLVAEAKREADHQWWLQQLELHQHRKAVIETIKWVSVKKHDAIADEQHKWWQQMLARVNEKKAREEADHRWWRDQLAKAGTLDW